MSLPQLSLKLSPAIRVFIASHQITPLAQGQRKDGIQSRFHQLQHSPSFPTLLPPQPYHSTATPLNPLVFLRHTCSPNQQSIVAYQSHQSFFSSYNCPFTLDCNNILLIATTFSQSTPSKMRSAPLSGFNLQPLALSLLHSSFKIPV
jgi:hypothetical protein